MAIITEEKMKNLDRDILNIGEANNEDKIINPRYGQPFKSLPMLSRLFEEMLGVGYVSVDDLKQAIEVAAAAGAGENGWIDTLVLTLTGENLREFNKKTISTLDCIDDLATTLPWQGRTVNVRSVIRNKHLGGGTFVFNKNSTRTPDGYIVVADVGGNWEKITVAFPTVDDFGGLGDDPNYDDADAFIRCALSPYTGSNIYLA
ncbi:TPA: hypothetical protein JIE77_000657, partial [Acinetobacter baumannii]|nr:hypothetical protein [Acinetobacter baumannii]